MDPELQLNHPHPIDADLPLKPKQIVFLFLCGILIVSVWGLTMVHLLSPRTLGQMKTAANHSLAQALGTLHNTSQNPPTPNLSETLTTIKHTTQQALQPPTIPPEALPEN